MTSTRPSATLTDSDAVLAANLDFYRAFSLRNFAAMDALWAREAQVLCLHPGWEGVHGRAAVMESWRAHPDRRWRALPHSMPRRARLPVRQCRHRAVRGAIAGRHAGRHQYLRPRRRPLAHDSSPGERHHPAIPVAAHRRKSTDRAQARDCQDAPNRPSQGHKLVFRYGEGRREINDPAERPNPHARIDEALPQGFEIVERVPSSTTPMAPLTRTSFTPGKSRQGASSRASCRSIAATCARRGSRSNRSSEALAAAQASALPMKVGPCISAACRIVGRERLR